MPFESERRLVKVVRSQDERSSNQRPIVAFHLPTDRLSLSDLAGRSDRRTKAEEHSFSGFVLIGRRRLAIRLCVCFGTVVQRSSGDVSVDTIGNRDDDEEAHEKDSDGELSSDDGEPANIEAWEAEAHVFG
jgi:hypothetical protein